MRTRVHGIFAAFAAFATNPWANLVAGICLLAASLFDLFQTGFEQWLGIEIEVAHGAIVVAVFQIMRVLPDLVEASERISAGDKDEAATPGEA